MGDGAQSRAAILRAAVDRICTSQGAEQQIKRSATVLSAADPGSQATLSQASLSHSTWRMPNQVKTSNAPQKRQKTGLAPPLIATANHTTSSATPGLLMQTQQIADDGIRALCRALEMSRQREASSLEMMRELRSQLLSAYRIIAEHDSRHTDTLLGQNQFAQQSIAAKTSASASNDEIFSSTASTASTASTTSTTRRAVVLSAVSLPMTDVATPSSFLLGDDTWSHQSINHNCEQGPHGRTSFSNAGEDCYADSVPMVFTDELGPLIFGVSES